MPALSVTPIADAPRPPRPKNDPWATLEEDLAKVAALHCLVIQADRAKGEKASTLKRSLSIRLKKLGLKDRYDPRLGDGETVWVIPRQQNGVKP